MRMMAAAVAALALAAPAAAVTVIGFERIDAAYPSASYAQILGFYGGGLSSQGTSGPNYGMVFSANAVAVCLNPVAGNCSNASGGGAVPTSARGALGLAANGSATLDFATPYTGAIGFRYQVTPASAAVIQAWSGPGATGSLLASLTLFNTAPGCPAYNAVICPFGPGGLGFLTGVQSLRFAGQASGFVIDDLTFGAGNDPLPPPAVPEPAAWALLMTGFGLTGLMLRRRRAEAT